MQERSTEDVRAKFNFIQFDDDKHPGITFYFANQDRPFLDETKALPHRYFGTTHRRQDGHTVYILANHSLLAAVNCLIIL